MTTDEAFEEGTAGSTETGDQYEQGAAGTNK